MSVNLSAVVVVVMCEHVYVCMLCHVSDSPDDRDTHHLPSHSITHIYTFNHTNTHVYKPTRSDFVPQHPMLLPAPRIDLPSCGDDGGVEAAAGQLLLIIEG